MNTIIKNNLILIKTLFLLDSCLQLCILIIPSFNVIIILQKSKIFILNKIEYIQSKKEKAT
jgi:hypothetical protein